MSWIWWKIIKGTINKPIDELPKITAAMGKPDANDFFEPQN